MAETTINVKFQGGVRIDIGVTPQLERLLQRLTDTKEEPKPQMLTADDPQRFRDFLSALRPSDSYEPTKDAPHQEQPTEDPHEAGEEPANEPQPVYDVEFVRAAIDRTRRRIEGEDYKDDTTSERYRKYHRQLTSEFKNLALQIGGCKPTELATPEQRIRFVEEIDKFSVDSDGNLLTEFLPY